MRIRMFGAAMLASTLILLMGTAGAADARYDRKLAQAAAEIVAERMGPLRGGFSIDEKPALLKPVPQPQAVRRPVRTELPPPLPGEWRGGLAIAVEKKSTASPEL